jgi:hypothetical protein
MLRFKQFINESLNLDQKEKMGIYHYPDSRQAARELSKHVIPDDKQSINIPLTHNTREEVKSHLEKHGFDLENYPTGKAKDKHGREVNIGSVLKAPKTAAPDSLVKGFENDDRHTPISPETHHILFSHKPEHIAECSTNKKWKSCASLTPKGGFTPSGGGVAARKIKDHLKAGTHVAYLMKKAGDQQNADNAEARILLHPYHSQDEHGEVNHTVLMPERKVYSMTDGKHSDFNNSLEDFTRKHYPMKEGVVYNKDANVYDDDDDRIRFNTSPKSVKKILTNPKTSSKAKEAAIKAVKLPTSTISSVLNEPTTDENRDHLHTARSLIAKHQKLNDTHFDALAQKGHLKDLALNKSLSKNQVAKIANHTIDYKKLGDDVDENNFVHHAQNMNLTKAHANLIHTHMDKLKPEHLHKIIDHHAKFEKGIPADVNYSSYDTPIQPLIQHKGKLDQSHLDKLKTSRHSLANRF